eukprot:gb/GFBE01011101.1/.p1 GENE.gb/GFBE01011101.1/~~gb/GFBE01011101.1/.p1  ORF type:complete len:112 (+),score=17.61 gb/GFBE01011101.1/:1-336(+)
MGEILDVQAGPVPEPSQEGVIRVHARALRDGTLGWITVSASSGVNYLVRGGNIFKAVRSTQFEEEGTGSSVPVHAGQEMEVLDCSRQGLARFKVRHGQQIGWISMDDLQAA